MGKDVDFIPSEDNMKIIKRPPPIKKKPIVELKEKSTRRIMEIHKSEELKEKSLIDEAMRP